jgi:hypothetical protein
MILAKSVRGRPILRAPVMLRACLRYIRRSARESCPQKHECPQNGGGVRPARGGNRWPRRHHGDVPQFLVVSIVLSIVLTVVLNLVLWLFPGVSRWTADRAERAMERTRADGPGAGSSVRVIFPWKAMLIGSLVLTVVLNLVLLFRR